MLLQAYDFVELARRYKCNLQMGGSDQWGNIVIGVDLGRRMGTHQLYALTCPLLDHLHRRQDGQDGGKAPCGSTRTSSRLMTTGNTGATPRTAWWSGCSSSTRALPLDEIAKLAALKGAEINEAKKVLATEATALLHGREKAEAAARTAQETFEQGATSEGLPTVEIALDDLKLNLGRAGAFVEVGLVASNGEARRQIRRGGLRVNDVVVTDEKAQLLHGRHEAQRGSQIVVRQEAPHAAEAGVTAECRASRSVSGSRASGGMTPDERAALKYKRHSGGGRNPAHLEARA